MTSWEMTAEKYSRYKFGFVISLCTRSYLDLEVCFSQIWIYVFFFLYLILPGGGVAAIPKFDADPQSPMVVAAREEVVFSSGTMEMLLLSASGTLILIM